MILFIFSSWLVPGYLFALRLSTGLEMHVDNNILVFMFAIFSFIRKYSFLLVIVWMVLYAFDLIDDLRNNYVNRSSSDVAWMLASDFARFLLVIGIWIASNFDPDRKEEK